MTDLYSHLGIQKSVSASSAGRGTLTEAVETADQDRSAVDRLKTTLPIS